MRKVEYRQMEDKERKRKKIREPTQEVQNLKISRKRTEKTKKGNSQNFNSVKFSTNKRLNFQIEKVHIMSHTSKYKPTSRCMTAKVQNSENKEISYKPVELEEKMVSKKGSRISIATNVP